MDRIAKGNKRYYAPSAQITVAGGKGMWLWDESGNRYIDLTCGFSVTNLGHSYEPIVDAVTRQVQQLDHVTGQAHALQWALADKLLEIFASRIATDRDKQARIAFASSGARAVEVAVRCAKAFRPGAVIRLKDSFHGRTLAFTEIHGGVVQQPTEAYFPTCQRCPLELSFPACRLACANAFVEYIENRADEISAILIEPILGVAGWVVPPDDFLQRLWSLTKRCEIVLIADEVQTALGRCGNWTRMEQLDIKPDLLVIGKSLAAGMAPISAVMGPAEIMDSPPPGSLTETFAANPIACAAAIATLECLQDGSIFESAKNIGDRLRSFCNDALGDLNLTPLVGGVGASCTIQFLGESQVASNNARSLVEACLKTGLLTHLAGPKRDRVALLPPLNLRGAETEEVCKRIDQAVAESASHETFR